MSDSIRIDKWLWAVRIFKTRSLASAACRNGKIEIKEQSVKPSRSVSIGDIVYVKKPPLTFRYKVTGLISKRVSAKTASDFIEDITPPEELLKVKTLKESAFFIRDRGSGRPTKKERRIIDRFRT